MEVQNLYADSSTDKAEWYLRARNLVEKLEALLSQRTVTAVYCEFPEFMDSASGYMVATKGDLQKLTFLVGAFARCVWGMGIPFEAYLVSTWKGQLSKEAVIGRIKKRIPDVIRMRVKSHSWDAIGIGLFAKGVLHEK